MSTSYISVSAITESTPGFSFGRSGNCSEGTYLQVDGVPSNLAGRVIPFGQAFLYSVLIVCQNDATFDLDIQKRNGNVFTTVYTANVVASRTFTSLPEGIEFLLGDEVCVKISSGSTSNIVVGLIIKGSGQ